ncbi:MAG: 50S ribosomal protein L21 [Armatimonadetes bacterium]|nr:50S ribosomal protein L21 [Armatimonadota bacterium]
MYALIESGGQQHKVEPGRYVTLGRLAVAEGESVVFDRVLLVRTDADTTVGTPVVEGAEVRGTVRRHLRGPKVNGIKYKAKKGYSKRWGARADLTQVDIVAVVTGGQTFEVAAATTVEEA